MVFAKVIEVNKFLETNVEKDVIIPELDFVSKSFKVHELLNTSGEEDIGIVKLGNF